MPVVASAVGGIPEIVRDRETGLLFGPGDARGMSEAVRLVLGDVALRNRLVARASQAVRERFSMDAMCRAYLAVYEQAARKQK